MLFEKRERLKIASFLAVFVITVLLQGLFLYAMRRLNLASLIFCALIIAWSQTIEKRITAKNVKRMLTVSCYFLIGMFILRITRYNLDPYVNNAYFLLLPYITMTVVPLLSFFASMDFMYITPQKKRAVKILLMVMWCAMITLILTNSLHGTVFEFYIDKGELEYNYRPFYYAVIAWEIVLSALSFATLVHRCTVSLSRKRVWLPITAFGICMGLFLWYALNNGSPSIGDVKLFFVHEIYAFTFIISWEACIQIGLVPSNTGYDEIFNHSSLKAEIKDVAQHTVYSSDDADFQQYTENGNFRIRTKAISGGSVTYAENLSAINGLNAEIENSAEQLKEQNILLEEANRIEMERTQIETQNTLYDEIEAQAHERLQRVDALLNVSEQEDNAYEHIALAALQCAYIKRRTNLFIINSAGAPVSVFELAYAIKETLEYTAFLGLKGEVFAEQDGLCGGDNLLSLYDAFEAICESLLGKAHFITVSLSAAPVPALKITADCMFDDPHYECETEDGVSYITLRGGKESNHDND